MTQIENRVIDFSSEPGQEWQRFVLPGSVLEHTGASWRFVTEPAGDRRYTDAQIDDSRACRADGFCGVRLSPWRCGRDSRIRLAS